MNLPADISRRKKSISLITSCGIILYLIFTTSSILHARDESAEKEPEKEYFRFGFSVTLFPGIDKNDAKIATDFWLGTILSKMPSKPIPQSTLFDSIDELAEAVRKHQLDGCYLASIDYVMIKDKVDLIPILTSSMEKKITDQYALLVRKDGNIKDISQIKGKELIIDVGGKGDFGYVWLDTLLMKRGLPEVGRYCSSIREVTRVYDAVLPLVLNDAEVCMASLDAFGNLVELYPRIGDLIEQLAVSPEFLRTLVCIRSDYNPDNTRILIETACSLHEGAIGKQVLMLFKRDKLVQFEPASIMGMINLVNEYRKLKEQSAGSKPLPDDKIDQ